jgi:hypothetical protein
MSVTTSPSRVRPDGPQLLAQGAPLRSPRRGPLQDLDANVSPPSPLCTDPVLTAPSQAEPAGAARRTTSCRSQSAPALTER